MRNARYLFKLQSQIVCHIEKNTYFLPARSRVGELAVKTVSHEVMNMTIPGIEERTDKLLMFHADNLKRKYKTEIERAIDRIKHPRSEWDKKFRKEWHKAKWRRIKGYRRFAQDKSKPTSDWLPGGKAHEK